MNWIAKRRIAERKKNREHMLNMMAKAQGINMELLLRINLNQERTLSTVLAVKSVVTEKELFL